MSARSWSAPPKGGERHDPHAGQGGGGPAGLIPPDQQTRRARGALRVSGRRPARRATPCAPGADDVPLPLEESRSPAPRPPRPRPSCPAACSTSARSRQKRALPAVQCIGLLRQPRRFPCKFLGLAELACREPGASPWPIRQRDLSEDVVRCAQLRPRGCTTSSPRRVARNAENVRQAPRPRREVCAVPGVLERVRSLT